MAEEVRAEMVANVWKVLVAEGDAVVDGDTLVILESMKMEIPVASPAAGKVKTILVTLDEVIAEGQAVAIIET